MAFGRHPLLTFIDDDTATPISAGNKNEEQRVIELTDNELSRSKEYNFDNMKRYYYEHNTKTIEVFDDNTDWSTSGSITKSDDTVNYQINFNSVKMLENDNTAGNIYIYRTISSIDLTTFNDGSSSSSSDFISLVLYISDYTKFTDIYLKLGSGASNYYQIQVDVDYYIGRSGWVILYFKKSEFTDVSGPGWDNITFIRIETPTDTGGLNEYVSVQLLQLVRADPDDSDKCNPFQSYIDGSYVNDLTPSEPWSIVQDNSINKLVMVEFEQYDFTNNQYGLIVMEDVINFVYKARLYPKSATQGILSFTWRVNDENYLEFYIQNNAIHVRAREAGSTTYYDLSLTNNLTENRMVDVLVEKYSQGFKFWIDQGGESTKRIEGTTTISADSEGDLYFGHYSTSQLSVINDFTISHNSNCLLPERARIIKNETVDQSTTSATYTTCSDLWVNLKPNTKFKIELNLVFNCALNTPQIDTTWVATNVELIGGINVIGMAVDSTNSGKAEYGKFASYDNFTDIIYFGTDDIPCYSKYSFLCKTGTSGGKLQFKFRQRNTDGSNPVYVRKESYFEIYETD